MGQMVLVIFAMCHSCSSLAILCRAYKTKWSLSSHTMFLSRQQPQAGAYRTFGPSHLHKVSQLLQRCHFRQGLRVKSFYAMFFIARTAQSFGRGPLGEIVLLILCNVPPGLTDKLSYPSVRCVLSPQQPSHQADA